MNNRMAVHLVTLGKLIADLEKGSVMSGTKETEELAENMGFGGWSCYGKCDINCGECHKCMAFDRCKQATAVLKVDVKQNVERELSVKMIVDDATVICLDNEGMEDIFVVGTEYVASECNPIQRDFIVVMDKYGEAKTCTRSRFEAVT